MSNINYEQTMISLANHGWERKEVSGLSVKTINQAGKETLFLLSERCGEEISDRLWSEIEKAGNTTLKVGGVEYGYLLRQYRNNHHHGMKDVAFQGINLIAVN